MFPVKYPDYTSALAYAWRKTHGDTTANYFTIPKHFNYANIEVLMNAFYGKEIKTTPENIEEIPYSLKERLLKNRANRAIRINLEPTTTSSVNL